MKKVRDNGIVDIVGSLFADHLIHHQHNFDPATDVTLLHYVEKGRLMLKLESIKILCYANDLTVILLNDLVNTDSVMTCLYEAIFR
jgi:hypothetical protein